MPTRTRPYHTAWRCLGRRASSRTVASFLEHPAVPVRVRKVGEAGVVPARGIEPGGEAAVPCGDRRLVPDIADLNAAFQQTAARGLQIRDDEIGVTKRSGGRVGDSPADLDRAARARGRELHD